MAKFVARLALASVLVAAIASGSASAYHTTCGSSNTGKYVAKTLQNPNGTVDQVNPKKIDNFKLPKGTTDVIVDGAGDVDITVCNAATGADVCESHEAAGVPDECPGLSASAQYYLFVKHCTDLSCGYPADSPSAIPYVVIVTNL